MAELYTATERLFLTADKSKVVKEGDPRAAFLYATPGSTVPAEEAAKYGLKQAAAPTNKSKSAPATKADG